jgi:hypothetical protein
VRDLGSAVQRAEPRLVVLIHGFANSQRKAERSYDAMVRKLIRATPGPDLAVGTVWEFHWPGDNPVPLVNQLTYFKRITPAKLAGAELARWIAQRRPRQSVVILAHSLGCRVALETMKALPAERAARGGGGAGVHAVFLLAAAVPVSACRFGGDYAAAVRPSVEHAFHSRFDTTLRLAFPPGQMLGGEPGDAVGVDGHPLGRWDGRLQTNLTHGRYWKSKRVAAEVCVQLGLRAPRELPSRPLPRIDARTTPHELAQNELARRGAAAAL